MALLLLPALFFDPLDSLCSAGAGAGDEWCRFFDDLERERLPPPEEEVPLLLPLEEEELLLLLLLLL